MLSTTARHTAVLVFCFVAFAGTLIVTYEARAYTFSRPIS